MNRRDLFKAALLSSCVLGGVLPARYAQAADSNRFLLNMVLNGGPDFRHLLVPPYNSDRSSYGYTYWKNRYQAHNIGNSESAWQSRWENDYDAITVDGIQFGVLKKASWLKDQIVAGNVAIINNAFISENRDHSHSLLKLKSGDVNTGANDFSRDGWGGRLAESIDANVCSMSNLVSLFCYGPDADPSNNLAHSNQRIISAKDTKNMALSVPSSLVDNPSSKNSSAIMARALKSYYQAKQDDIDESSIFHRFVQHEKNYRSFGEQVDAVLANNPTPEAIEGLLSGENALSDRSFATQIRNTYDCYMLSDVLNFRVGSLEMGGFDSHRDQVSMIEPNFENMFGAGKGFNTLFDALKADMLSKYNNTTLVISGEFGRQLAANGDQGTDHGRGNAVLVIGPQVNGGLYGEMFPNEEIEKYQQPSADILVQTSMIPVFAKLCDWLSSGAGTEVFPDRNEQPIEAGVNLNIV